MSATMERLSAVLADRYRIERELGQGGMATVYLAQDLRHERSVAIKVFRPELAAIIGAERFLREIGVTAQLLHPHILTLIDSGEADGLLYYVMPYVEGESVRGRLDRAGALPLGEGLRILRDVVDAMAYAHQRRVIHRDLKPENVLLSGRHALVADFGIAKGGAGGNGDSRTALTSAGVALGTPGYMAPEQAAADPSTDQRADIYAIGVLAYELFSGSPPFAGATRQEIVAAHFARTPEPLTRRRAEIPVALEQLVMRCLEKAPDDRWQSAEELLHRIEALLAADPARLPAATRPSEPVDRTFRLSEEVCRKLNRATLDPRIIDDNLHYLDNQVTSPVLICLLHGLGLSQDQFTRHLQLYPYRSVAPTLYGLDAGNQRRIPVALDDHLTIIREFLDDQIRRLRPEVVLLVGFSSGGDFGFRLLEKLKDDPEPRIDGFVSLGCNLTLATCFVSSLFARMEADRPDAILEEFRTLGQSARDLDEWLNQQEYVVQILRKFRGDIEPLRRLAREVVKPFATAGDSPFIGWYRAASQRVRALRCVFEDAADYQRPLSDIRLRNLDDGILGTGYSEGSIVVERDTDHFSLARPELISRYIEEMLGR